MRAAVPALVIAAAVVAIAWAFVRTVLYYTPSMGLPLDDSYIYLTYAKQFGRGEPFTYFHGGGYSAGSTSVLWPMVLAPFWTLGARGHALVWVSYLACTACFAFAAIGVWRVVRTIGGGDVAGVVAALALAGIAPFAWTSLSGMEVGFASALLVALIALLIEQAPAGPPSRRLGACLAAASLSRPEVTVIVVVVIGVAVLCRARRREWRAAAWWIAPLAAPVAWLVANRLLAGTWFPNTGVAKSYFYLPGFDWTYWWDTVTTTAWKMLTGVFWDDASPLPWPRLVAVLWLVGVVRVLAWAHRARRMLAGFVIVTTPLVLMAAVVTTSGLWIFHNYRYIAPGFAVLVIPVGAALGPVRRERAVDLAIVLGGAGFATILLVLAERPAMTAILWLCAIGAYAMLLPLRWVRLGVLALALALYARAAMPGLQGDARLYAQGVIDTNLQVVAIGRYVNHKLPDARVMFHDAGAIAYYGDGRVYDMLGLVTNHQAGVANHGPGARFEFLESLPPDRRPTHFAYYPSWLGNGEFFGDVVFHTPLSARIKGLVKVPFVGDIDMQVIVASFDHVGTGERPLVAHAGWHVVDRVDIADLASERAHGWRGELGRRAAGDTTAKWSVVGRETGARGLVLDGGRTIRGGEEFTLELDPAKPTRLVMRTGGETTYPWNETILRPVALRVGEQERALPVPNGQFEEVVFDLPAGVTHVATRAAEPYRVFHWFALQRD